MPELGRYAAEVLSAYGVSLGLLGGLTAAVLLRARSVRRRLADMEREGRHG